MIGEITERYWKEIQYTAKKRNISFLLTPEQAWKTYLMQNQKCKITNKKLNFHSQGHRGIASLDRINSFKPYTAHNVQWIYSPINIMKKDYHESYFRFLCEMVVFGHEGKTAYQQKKMVY